MTEKETTIAIALTELNDTLFRVRRIQSIIEETFNKVDGHMTTSEYHSLLYGPDGITDRLDRIANDIEMVSDLSEVVVLSLSGMECCYFNSVAKGHSIPFQIMKGCWEKIREGTHRMETNQTKARFHAG